MPTPDTRSALVEIHATLGSDHRQKCGKSEADGGRSTRPQVKLRS